MNLQNRIKAISDLGMFLTEAASDSPSTREAKAFSNLIDSQQKTNKWFTPDNVRMAIAALGEMTGIEKLEKWLSAYSLPADDTGAKKIGLIMAGNIPLVGFHDLISVILSGHIALVKPSSKDSSLVKAVVDILKKRDPGFGSLIRIFESELNKFDAVIATGSDNTSRYFEYYFGSVPHIFRKNRNSVAVMEGNETSSDIRALGNDIFSYFGLGCRSVSKIMLPSGYDPVSLMPHWVKWEKLTGHKAYFNNIRHHRALFGINGDKYFDGGFIILRENGSLTSPVGVLHFEFYNSTDELETKLHNNAGAIQIIVGKTGVKFGFSQKPEPWEYPDNRDTLSFLLGL